LAGKRHIEGRGADGATDFFLHLREGDIRMGGIEVCQEESSDFGRNGLFQADFWGAMSPTPAIGVLLFRVLTVTNQQVGLMGQLSQRIV